MTRLLAGWCGSGSWQVKDYSLHICIQSSSGTPSLPTSLQWGWKAKCKAVCLSSYLVMPRMCEATRTAPKLLPPILLCWPTTSEANVVDMAVEVELSRQYSVKFCCRATDDSRGAVWQNGVWHGSAYEAKVCNWICLCGKKFVPYDIHRRLLKVCGDQTVDVSTVRRWGLCRKIVFCS